MRKITLVFGAALPFLCGCATVGPLGSERGQGTSRLVHGSSEQILKTARQLPVFRTADRPGTSWRLLQRADGIYLYPTDFLQSHVLPARFSILVSATDANGDTLTEAVGYKYFFGSMKAQAEANILESLAKYVESGQMPPTGGAAPNIRDTSTQLALTGDAPPAPPQSYGQNVIRSAKTPHAAPEQEASAPASVSSDVDRPRRKLAQDTKAFAVVIGVEKYSNDLPDAKFAEHDAQAVRASLVALGYPDRNIKFLTGARASKSNLEAYIEEWLPRNVKEGDKVFFYFSGHGAPDPESGQAYLVPVDGDPNYLGKTAYPVKTLYASLGKLKAKQIVVALDSCFSGAGGRSVLAEGARPLVTKVDASVGQDSKITLFAAASPKEITSTIKEQGHGMFTYYFLKGLEGAAADENGSITAQRLYDYLKPQVQDAASRQNRDQTPMLEGASDRELAKFH